MRTAYLLELDQTDYETTLGLQRRCAAARKNGHLDRDLVMILEHLPVFTLGRRGGRQNLLVPEQTLQQRGISVVPIERGGDITYHGPGQLVAYIIFDLKSAQLSVTELVAALEKVMVATAGFWGIRASGNNTYRGAWVGKNKLGSIGITIRRGVSFHGLALNVNTDLEPFGWINPCGIQGCSMTSIAQQTDRTVTMTEARAELKRQMAATFGLNFKPLELARLAAVLPDQTA